MLYFILFDANLALCYCESPSAAPLSSYSLSRAYTMRPDSKMTGRDERVRMGNATIRYREGSFPRRITAAFHHEVGLGLT